MIYVSLGFIFAAALGAWLRMQSASWLVAPWGTLLVNVLGSLVIGFLAVALEKQSPQLKSIVFVALLGSLTTFSTYSLEIVRFFNSGQFSKALLYFVLSNLLAFLGCFIGWKIAQNMVNSH